MSELYHRGTTEESFSSKFNSLASTTETWLQGAWPQADDTLTAACRYSVLSPGKRFRGVLALLSAELLGIPLESVRTLAVALELIHAASLVHDDLPLLDNDTLRRGQPTTHVKFGAGVAVLAGDAILSRAFSIATEGELSDAVKVRLMTLLARASYGVCDGQVLDLEVTSKSSDDLFELRHRRKTGALIAAAAAGPALLIENGPVEVLHRFGLSLGMLFQITDDLLDAVGTTETTGKNVATDSRLGRETFISRYGVEGAKMRAHVEFEACIEALEDFGDRARDLRSISALLLGRQR